jgi:hypothetical protein
MCVAEPRAQRQTCQAFAFNTAKLSRTGSIHQPARRFWPSFFWPGQEWGWAELGWAGLEWDGIA